MSSKRWRLSVYLLIVLMTVAMIGKSRTLPVRESVAFLRYTTGAIMLKVKGKGALEGVYRIFDADKHVSANNLTLDGRPFLQNTGIPLKRSLENGGVIEVSDGYWRTTTEKMTAIEMIMLGAPLDASIMSVADWNSLPGIGSSLAREIESYSQKNGGIDSVEELAELPGVGKGKINKIRTFFR